MENPYHRNQIGTILGEISEQEFQKGRPLISAIVINKSSGKPGSGFFTLAQELGLFNEKDDIAFHIKELKRVFDYWKHI